MKTDGVKNLAYYENLPYTIVMRRDEEGGFVAKIQELQRCTSHGDTEAEAIENLRSMQRLWLESALEASVAIPEPEDDADSLPSGKWLQRVPRRLHRDLVAMAQRDNVSLNQLVTSMLSEALTAKSCLAKFDAFILNARVNLNAAPIHVWWDRFYQSDEAWSTTLRKGQDSIVKKLARAKSLKSGGFSVPYTIPDEYQEDHLAKR